MFTLYSTGWVDRETDAIHGQFANQDEAFKEIGRILKLWGVKSFYTRAWVDDTNPKAVWVDYGSHSNFFCIVDEDIPKRRALV